jgi:hypothetical protein
VAEPKRDGWKIDGIDPTTGDWNQSVATPPRRRRTRPSEYDYDLPPGYTKSQAATDRTRLITTGDPEGALIEDFAPGSPHGYCERPTSVVADYPHLLDPVRHRRHRPPEVR